MHNIHTQGKIPIPYGNGVNDVQTRQSEYIKVNKYNITHRQIKNNSNMWVLTYCRHNHNNVITHGKQHDNTQAARV
jgi:hypothetical protein